MDQKTAILEKYNGTLAEIQAVLDEQKPQDWQFADIFKEAFLMDHHLLLTALFNYKKSNEENFFHAEYHIVNKFTLEENKVHFNKLIQYLSEKKLLEEILKKALNDGNREVIKESLYRGVNINSLVDNIAGIDIKILQATKDIFLEHRVNPLTIENFLKLALITNGISTYNYT